MDLTALQAANNAVKKIMKDYAPIASLSQALDAVEKIANQVAEVDKVLASKKSELERVQQELTFATRQTESKKSELASATNKLAEVKAAIAKLAAAT